MGSRAGHVGSPVRGLTRTRFTHRGMEHIPPPHSRTTSDDGADKWHTYIYRNARLLFASFHCISHTRYGSPHIPGVYFSAHMLRLSRVSLISFSLGYKTNVDVVHRAAVSSCLFFRCFPCLIVFNSRICIIAHCHACTLFRHTHDHTLPLTHTFL